MIRAIRDELRKALAIPNIYLIGEDISEYGGAFGATRGLYPSEKIIETPISESCLVGMATGMAIGGMRPILEIMFMDFLTLGVDQLLNHALKYQQMYNNQVTVPLIIRTPYGAPEKCYGATHSQNLASLFATFPGLTIFVPSDVGDTRELFRIALQMQSPVLFMEPKALYWRDSPDVTKSLGTAAEVRTYGSRLTVVTYGEYVQMVEDLNKKRFLPIELINLRILKPIDMETILASVRRTGKCLVIDGCTPICSIASDIAARVQQQAWSHLQGPVHILTPVDSVIPVSTDLVEQTQITSHKIYLEIMKMLED